MKIIKKSELIGVDDETFYKAVKVMEDFRRTLKPEDLDILPTLMKEKVLKINKNKDLYETLLYICGELTGKIEAGMSIVDLFTSLVEETTKQTSQIDDLITNYKPAVVN